MLDEADWCRRRTLAPVLEHTAKWPPEHWRLAFQGQIRAVSEHDARLLMDRMGAIAVARAMSLVERRPVAVPRTVLAGGAAVALFVTMLLPWYDKSFFQRGQVVHDGLNAFQAFSWVEAAVLLVAASVLGLLYARSQRRGFHLPGGDGTRS